MSDEERCERCQQTMPAGLKVHGDYCPAQTVLEGLESWAYEFSKVCTARPRLLYDAAEALKRYEGLINSPETADFLEGVKREAAHQRERWGAPHDREKSAEHWYWLVGYLAGKALRAAIGGDKVKAQHHTISSAAALLHWHSAISRDASGTGLGRDADLQAHDDGRQAHETAPVHAS